MFGGFEKRGGQISIMYIKIKINLKELNSLFISLKRIQL